MTHTATIIFVVLGIWLLILTGILAYCYLILANLKKVAGEKDFLKALKDAAKSNEENKVEIKELKKAFERIELAGEKHIQKVGLVRYNPFEETGGDHSFTLSLLDKNDTGIILTGLHTRERTRIYIKDIVKRKSKFELSKEEKNAIESAS